MIKIFFLFRQLINIFLFVLIDLSVGEWMHERKGKKKIFNEKILKMRKNKK